VEVRYFQGLGIIYEIVSALHDKETVRPTFSETTNTLAIDRVTSIIRISRQKQTKMLDYGTADEVGCDPFDNGLCLDVAQLLQRYFLRARMRREK
jgi:hypothetical protein